MERKGVGGGGGGFQNILDRDTFHLPSYLGLKPKAPSIFGTKLFSFNIE